MCLKIKCKYCGKEHFFMYYWYPGDEQYYPCCLKCYRKRKPIIEYEGEEDIEEIILKKLNQILKLLKGGKK